MAGASGAIAPRSLDSSPRSTVRPTGSTAQGRSRRAHPRRQLALRLGLAALIALPLAALRLIPAAAGSGTPTWPKGIVRVYDASGMAETVATAAARWTGSGANVDVEMVDNPGTPT